MSSVVDKAVDFVTDAGKGIIDVGSDIVENIDLEDAFTTYIATGGNPYAAAFAATDYDEDLGFNPAAFYDPSSGGFSLTQPTSGGDNTFGTIFGGGEGQIDLGEIGNIIGNIGLEYAKSEFMPGESGGYPDQPQDTSLVFDQEGITRAALDYFFGRAPGATASPSSFFNFGNIGLPALTSSLLTSGAMPFDTSSSLQLGQFLKDYPSIPAGILAGLSYADRKRLNEQIEEGFAQYQGGKQAFADKIASGTVRKMPTRSLAAQGGRIGFAGGTKFLKGIKNLLDEAYEMVSSRSDFDFSDYKMRGTLMAEELAELKYGKSFDDLDLNTQMDLYQESSDYLNDVAADAADNARDMMKERFNKAEGGIMSSRKGYMMGTEVPLRQNQAGVSEMDFRDTGGFVPPVGIKEKADDIPAMLSNNEFVFTADAVRAAGGGSVNKGAEKMYALMKQLEGQA